MEIILTHEQADFDALASLLGAYLLDDRAVPVLPRRLNRNVRAFLTLYGLEFPFIEAQDLPKKKIDRITLVDTQSLITVKGVHNKTEVYVIDHHALRTDTPAEWHVTTEDIGATSTLLVELLQTRDLHLSIHQATLLLLGIYEDTGQLTYSRTTPRDVRAAAYLLDQGASLQILQDYINHPLSHTQQAIYDQARQTIETHSIHGNTVMVGWADARYTDEELSTIVHKLRDLLDPDALFLLVDTGGGTQLIARATSDQVDVGAVAEHYGGGGHPRAAAALIREQDARQVGENLVEILPKFVHPAITVAEIMSRRPQLLAPDTPVRKVAQLMQRYGYEGYPVVNEGKLVGLLTRRAVDRTMGHKLNLTARDVMDAGQVTISPEAPLEKLQQVMMDSGWGQVPVVVEGEIIGIVTRTDLIKTLTPQQSQGGRQNLAQKLEESLPTARLSLLRAVAEQAQQTQTALYIVGGFVRDLLLDRPSLDFDLVVEGDAIALGRALVEKYGGRTTTHRRFGTAKWQIEAIRPSLAKALSQEFNHPMQAEAFPETLDLVSARREFYTHPTALPTVERGSIKLDLHRRDFTINTLALRLDGTHYGDLHDYWGGLADLSAGLVRVLHSLSFVDDPTRILRAVRFEQRFAYQIETRTLELLVNALPLLDRVSGDRLRHELNTILQEPNWSQMIQRMASLGVLESIHPEIPWDAATEERVRTAMQAQTPDSWGVPFVRDGYPLPIALSYLAWLLPVETRQAQDICTRLKVPGWLADTLQAAHHTLQRQAEIIATSPYQAVTILEEIPPLALFIVDILTTDASLRQKIETYFVDWQHIKPVTTGHDLRAREIPPGPHYQFILDALRSAWLEGTISSQDEEKQLLEKLIDDYKHKR